MALLDRFRSRPLWQHPDAAVRAEAVRNLRPEDIHLALAIFREDQDVVVRRAALRRVSELDALVEAARNDADEEIRQEARSLLLKQATDASDADRAARAAGVLDDPRQLATLARSARVPSVRQDALSRLQDPRSLASVAKGASDGGIRLQALARLDDAALIAEVAGRSEHRDVALAALQRVSDEAALQEIAQKGRHKAVARRAKALLDARGASAQALTGEQRNAKATEAWHSLVALQSSHDWPKISEALDRAEETWAGLGEGVEESIRSRFTVARDALQARLAAHQRDQAAAAESAASHARVVAEREALLGRIEALTGDDALTALGELESAWAALPTLLPPDGPRLAQRFEHAVTGCRRRHDQWMADAERRRRLEELAQELEPLVDLPLEEAKPKARELRKEWDKLKAAGPVAQDLEARAHVVLVRLGERQAEARASQEKLAKQNEERLVALCARLDEQAKEPEKLTLREAEKALREIREALQELGPLPSRKERDAFSERLKTARVAIYPKAQELREAEEWKLWANVAVQEELCAEMEGLVTQTDLAKVVEHFPRLGEKWRRFSQARKEEAEALWTRFKTARDAVQLRIEEHQKQRAAEEKENLEKKLALCARAEALSASTEWLKTADELKKLQAEWKTIGPVPQKSSKPVWDRFHGACDRFFSARKEDLSKRKDEWAKNLERKEALCVRAEELSQSSEWDKAADELKKLQAEWKTIGPVKRSKSELIWQRFRAACDAFFERYKKRDQIVAEAQTKEREAIVDEIEALLPPADAAEPTPAPEGLLAKVQDILYRWRQAPSTPHDRGSKLNERFFAARDRAIELWADAFKGSELDPEGNRTRREKLVKKVEGLVEQFGAKAQAEGSLADRLREALATNAMGGRAAHESRWRSAAAEVESAQTAWKRIGPVPGDAGKALADRFRKACDRFNAAKPR